MSLKEEKTGVYWGSKVQGTEKSSIDRSNIIHAHFTIYYTVSQIINGEKNSIITTALRNSIRKPLSDVRRELISNINHSIQKHADITLFYHFRNHPPRLYKLTSLSTLVLTCDSEDSDWDSNFNAIIIITFLVLYVRGI
jgi:hypothetical protein